MTDLTAHLPMPHVAGVYVLLMVIAFELLGISRSLRILTAPRRQQRRCAADGRLAGMLRRKLWSQPLTFEPPRSQPTFICDSLFLTAAWRFAISHGADETFFFVGGYKLEPQRYVLAHIVPVAHSHQTPTGATAELGSSFEVFEQLDRFGLIFTAHFHSHPGRGIGATSPSSIDRRYAGDLAAGSYRVVGGIFSRDGYLRFYADETMAFCIEVNGNHVTKVRDYVYKIEAELVDSDLPVTLPRHRQ